MNTDGPVKLLITTPNLDTAGMKYVIADLVKGLDRSKVSPSLGVHRLTRTPLELELASCVDDLFELPLRVPTRPRLTLPGRLQQTAKALRNRFDIVQSFDYASSWSEGLIVRLARIPWVMTKTNMNWGTRNWQLRATLASHIVCLSQAQGQLLGKHRSLRRKTTVIPIGIDLQRFAPVNQDKRAEIRCRVFEVPINAVVLGCVAHLVPVKGHVELLRAFSVVAKEYEDLCLILVGEGDDSYTAELKRLAEELEISSRVRFLGRRGDVPTILPACDGFILATRSWGRQEAFGAVVVEAMACGLPVIATKSGGPQDTVVHGKTGWLVDAEGAPPLAEAMREFVENRDRWSQFGQAGRKRAQEMFSKEAMIRRYEGLYLEVGNRGHS